MRMKLALYSGGECGSVEVSASRSQRKWCHLPKIQGQTIYYSLKKEKKQPTWLVFCVCEHARVHAHVCMHMWRPEVNTRSLPQWLLHPTI